MALFTFTSILSGFWIWMLPIFAFGLFRSNWRIAPLATSLLWLFFAVIKLINSLGEVNTIQFVTPEKDILYFMITLPIIIIWWIFTQGIIRGIVDA